MRSTAAMPALPKSYTQQFVFGSLASWGYSLALLRIGGWKQND